jgi:ribosome-associated protein
VTPEQLVESIRAAAEEVKAADIELVDIRGKTTIADYLLVCTGTADVHVRSIAEKINERLKAKHVRHDHVEGMPEATWVLMDYGAVLVHVMQAERRGYYRLEEFWTKMPLIEELRSEWPEEG